MNLRKCRRLALLFAFATILVGASVAFLPLPTLAREILGVVAILLAAVTIWVFVKWHRCPSCGKFVPFTGGYRTCIHCDEELFPEKNRRP